MDVVVVFNGMGNQMSQYAFFLQKKALEKSTQFFELCEVHNGLELNKVFNISFDNTISKRLLILAFKILLSEKAFIKPIKLGLKLLGFRVVDENFNYNYNQSYLLPSKGVTFYYGGWHSEKYFRNIETEIRKTFKFNETIGVECENLKRSILSCNSVGLHVRRGDYLNQENVDLFGKVCTAAYFQKAVGIVESKIDNPHFFVFSNDISWVRSNLALHKVTYVTCNKGNDSWKDMYLMTLCKHNIISNSSFSWWGAWLNINANKIVISPSRYLNNDVSTDFYPDSWIRLSNY